MDASVSPSRPARALVAWLSTQEGRRLGGGAADPDRRRAARDTRLQRPAVVDQSGLLGRWPSALEEHALALQASEGAKSMFAGGWEIGLITDLRRVIAAQPTVFVAPEDPVEPVPHDAAEIARIALPLSAPAAQVPVDFDEERQTWNITSPSPNLRITGNFGGEVEPGVLGFGFLVRVLPSFISLAEYRGRYILRDGYHRAYRFLSHGVLAVPAFIRRFADDESPFRSGMLPEEVYCGERPPTLQDYLDDAVAEDVWISPRGTTIAVSAGPTSLVFGRLA
ncbi:MAG TPA: hypothetical protein VMA77_22150 [Solirubrobacteraceae bacterium]|nr:hypothetical protein [Solirubrobacteraceae bacterium]